MKNKRTFLLGLITGSFLGLVLVAGFFIPSIAHGVTIEQVGGTIGLGTSDLKQVVINIIKWILGILGLVAVIMIMYGGFIWMTAGGNIEKVKKAKKIITRAVIGLVIVLLAWAIVLFVVRFITNSTGGPAGHCSDGTQNYDETGTDCGGADCPACADTWLPTDKFTWQETESTYALPGNYANNVFLCSRIKPRFNHNLNTKTVSDAAAATTLRIALVGPNTPFDGTWETSGKTMTFKHDKNLFAPNTPYEVQEPKTIEDTGNTALEQCNGSCTDHGTYYAWQFTTGTETDDVPPTITSSYPPDGDQNVSRKPVFEVNFSEAIDDTTIYDSHNSPHPIHGNFVLEQLNGKGGSVVATIPDNNLDVESKPGGFRVSLDASNLLEAFTWYRMTVKNVQDLCGNTMSGEYKLEFQTNDQVPGVANWYPTGANECPAVHIDITFGTTMYYNDVTIVVNGPGNSPHLAATINASNIDYYANQNYEIPGANAYIYITNPVNPNDPHTPIANYFTTFELVPTSPLPSNTNYTVTVTTSLVMDQSGSHLGKDWTFKTATADNCTCSPYITNITPNAGPKGQCVTINGYCFKGTSSHQATIEKLAFDTVDWTTHIGGSGDNYITTTVPDSFGYNSHPKARVTIHYNESAYNPVNPSDTAEFYVNSDTTASGPCLWTINPTSGYRGSGVALTGIRFNPPDNVKKEVHFSGAFQSSVPWSDTRANTSVPNLAAYGRSNVYVENDVGRSNTLPFDVNPIPPGRPVVISWKPSCDSACINAAVGGKISLDVSATINTTNIKLYSCHDDSCSRPLTAVNINATGTFIDPTPGKPNSGDEYTEFSITPSGNLNVNTSYRAVVMEGVQTAAGGALIGLNYDDDNNGVSDSFSWIFKTKNDASLCQLDHINVVPATATASVNNNLVYTGHTYGSPDSCNTGGQELNPAAYDWNWSATNITGTAQVTPRATNYIADVKALTSGTVQINATASNPTPPANPQSNHGDLTIFDCESDQHCQEGCPGSHSVCDLTAHKCTPAVLSLSPDNGPRGRTVTINGCYFEDKQGTGLVNFGGTQAELPCQNSWSNTQIVARNPLSPPGTPYVSVQTNSGLIPQPQDTKAFTLNNLCDGTTVPSTGLPGICPPLSPPAGRVGTAVTFNGYNLVGSPTNTVAQFSDGTGGFISATGGSGTGTQFGPASVPANSQTGPAKVVVQGCSSNTLNFAISCASNSDCSTGCCLGNVCRPSTACSAGGPGDPCQLRTNAPLFCQVGPLVTANNYRCIDTVGHRDPNTPPGAGYPPPSSNPAADSSCLVCCYPGQTNGSLTCSANQSPCTGGSRGLYCGCTNDLSCGNPAAIGCGSGNPSCCLGRPTISNVGPTGSGACLNTAITVNFPASVSLDGNSLNTNNVIFYSQEAVQIETGSNYTSCLINNADCNLHTAPDCTGSNVSDAVSCIDNAEWTYNFNINAAGNYLLSVKSGDNDVPNPIDLAAMGIYHNLEIYIDNASQPVGVIKNLATQYNTTGYTQGILNLGTISAGSHDIKIKWINDWGKNGLDSNVRIHEVSLIKGKIYDGSFQNKGSSFIFNPSENLASNTDYYVLVRGGARGNPSDEIDPNDHTINNDIGIRSTKGVFMWDTAQSAPDTDTISRLWKFHTGNNICRVDHLKTVIYYGGSHSQETTSNLYNCAGDNCSDDFLPGSMPGNQHEVEVTPVDAAGNLLSNCLFEESSHSPGGNVVDLSPGVCGGTCSNGRDPCSTTLNYTAKPKNGFETITYNFKDPTYGSASVDVNNTVFICENPWPNSLPPANQAFPYEDSSTNCTLGGTCLNTNFSTFYCRDGNPLLSSINYPLSIVKPGNWTGNNGKDELIKEFFFTRSGSDDAIGIRVMENESDLSPEKWYYKQFGAAAPAPSSLEVDGYPAVRAGRTVYVGATNLSGSTIYNNIYLISYNDGASSETLNIYNQLLANWRFNTNFTNASDKAALQRDIKRINDLQDIYLSLLTYKDKNKKFPLLSGGTYLQGFSTSVWPSWQNTLGKNLNTTLPTDPSNTINSCPADYEQKACWKESDKSFRCPSASNSHIYMYEVLSNGDYATLFANLEYTGAGSWASAPDSYTNDCPAGSACHCFNYQLNTTGTTADHQGPTIGMIAFLSVPGNFPMFGNKSGTEKVVVGVDDGSGGSGVAYVEFYIDGIRQSTDNDGSDGWSWTWNTTNFVDGAYEIKVIAYDKAGNHSTKTITVNVYNNSHDTKAPSVFIIAPTDGATVSGNSILFSVRATDNVGVSSLNLSVINSQGRPVHQQSAPSSDPPCTFNSCDYKWDGTSDPNGDYTLQATASDGTNSTTKTIKVTLKNSSDLVPPSIKFIASTPSDGSNVTGKQTIAANATDNLKVMRVEFLVDGNIKYTDVSPYGSCNKTTTTACLVDDDCPHHTPRIAGDETCGGAGFSNVTWVWDTTLMANGTHTLQARAWDSGNNSALSGTITVDVENASNDKVPPTVSFIAPTPAAGSEVHGGPITIAVDAHDDPPGNVVKVQFYVGDNLQFQDTGAPWTWDWQTTTTLNGWVKVTARAYDQAGNSSEVSRLFNVNNGKDVNPPVVNITAPSEGQSITGSSFTISANATETQTYDTGLASMEINIVNNNTHNTDATYACAVTHGSATQTCTYAWNIVTNGSYTITVSATDVAGNTGANSVDVSVVNSLLVNFVTPGSGATVSGTVSLSATVTGATGSVTVYYNRDTTFRIGQSTTSPFSVNWNTTTVSNGSHTLLAFAQDSLGAQGIVQITVTVSNAAPNQPPNITAFSINGGAAYANSTNVTLNITATDDSGVAQMQFSNDNSNWSAWQTYATTASWTLPGSDGSKTVYAKVRDNGSPALESGVAQATITLDTTPPAVAFSPAWLSAVSLAGNWVGGGSGATWPSTGNGNVTVSAIANDALSGVSIVRFYLDGSLKWTLSSTSLPYDWPNWGSNSTAEGDHTLSITAYDSVGNNASAVYSVHLSHCLYSTNYDLPNKRCNTGTACYVTVDPNACLVPPVCGNGSCEPGETCSTCVTDCGTCTPF